MTMRIDADGASRALFYATRSDSSPPRAGSDSRPPDQTFARVPRDQLEATVADARRSGDFSLLDPIDNFRQTLTPAQQAEYDSEVEALRRDPRVQFIYANNATPDPAMENLMLRGMVAATFGRPGLLDQTLDARLAAGQDNIMQIIVYPGDIPTADANVHYPGGFSAPLDGALVTPQGDILVDNDFMLDCLEYGENTVLHEFGHLLQYDGDADASGAATFPAGFPDIERVVAEFQTPQFQTLLQNMPYSALNDSLGGETFPTLLNVFRQYPALMRDTSPEMYAAFVDYYGVDPLSP